MNANLTEQRRHIRVYFNSTKEALCQLSSAERAVELVSASVLDLSMGGLRVSVTGGVEFAVGEQLVLDGLTHCTGMRCDQQLPLEIRWLAASAEIGRCDMGCRFVALSETSRASVDALIRMKISEYRNAGNLPIVST